MEAKETRKMVSGSSRCGGIEEKQIVLKDRSVETVQRVNSHLASVQLLRMVMGKPDSGNLFRE
jgi:hypothetical protein